MPDQRKVVTILFADVVGSTELATQRDPEVVRATMGRYFNRIGEIASAYGGTVEKFAGDAAMVVFGVPAVHDDDAERAVRAALEIRDRSAEVAVRVGVNTGEAVTAVTENRQFMVSGDTVNVAARLQQGAEAGDVLVGELTYRLTRDAIDYEPHDSVVAKGKPEPLPAHRAVRARSEVPTQARGVPGLQAALVGRDRELRLLIDTFVRATEDRNPHLFTLIGSAGIGKSRLVQEALTSLAHSGARVLRGRCLPYGRGITYWPLVEMLRQDTGIGLTDQRDAALLKLDRWLGELMSGDPERPAVRARLAVMMGLEPAGSAMPDTPAEAVEKEVGWAVRRYMVAIARAAPLLVVFDDVQWAEPPVVTIIDQLTQRVSDVPILLVCVGRPEFLEAHLGWSAGQPNATTITLEPLDPEETSTLISRLLDIEALPARLRERIIERSAGTPLFCEEFIHMLIDEGRLVRERDTWKAATAADQVEVPQTINAVLAARLDGLPEGERSLLQAASVIGQRFTLRQVEALVGGSDLETLLEASRRKSLVTFGEKPEDEFRFRHLLIRDAAYASLPKSQRAALHARFAAALEVQTADPLQLTEILAHHAERAFALSRELGLDEPTMRERAAYATKWLLPMADRARTRHDVATLESTLDSLRSAAGVLHEGGDRSSLARVRLLEAQLMLIRGEYRQAREASDEAAALADQQGLTQLVATARLTEAWIMNWAYEDTVEAFQAVVDQAIEACRRAGDVRGEIEAGHVGTFILWGTGRVEEFIRTNEDLIGQARAMGDFAHEAAIVARLISANFIAGNDDASLRAMEQAESLATRHGLRHVSLRVMMDKASRATHRDDLETAIRLWREYERAAGDAGSKNAQMSASRFLGYTLLHAGRPGEAADALDRCIALIEATGDRWNRAEVFSLRARAALETGELAAADQLIAKALEALRPQDVTAVSEVFLALGAVRAAEDRDAEAEAAFRRALDGVSQTAYLNTAAPAALGLAVFLAGKGRFSEAAQLADEYRARLHARGWHLFDHVLADYDRLAASYRS